jgi:hypothetical protein
MLRYPVDVKQVSSERFRAVWVDFPDLSRGEGLSARAAFEALIDRSYSAIADLVATGRYPPPSPAEGRPVVSFSLPGQILAPHLARVLAVTRRGTEMATYSWTNDIAYVE